MLINRTSKTFDSPVPVDGSFEDRHDVSLVLVQEDVKVGVEPRDRNLVFFHYAIDSRTMHRVLFLAHASIAHRVS